MGVRNMGEIIRLLAIDDNAERISKIAEQISKQYPDLHVEYPLDLKSLIQLHETYYNERSKKGETIYGIFPDTPKVVVRGEELFIINEDGLEEFWGSETNDNIEETASQMEMELRAVKWIKRALEIVISDLTEILMHNDVPHDQIPYIVFEGYRSLLFSFKKIDEIINKY